MSQVLSSHSHSFSRFPRVSGDEPRIDAVHETAEAFSPRERG